MRILVIEDDQRIAAFVERGLVAEGHRVDVAATGRDGLTLAADPDIEMVILDLGLPDMDGVAVLARLQQTSSTLSVLVLTARDAIAEKVRVLDAGAGDYLTKPFALDELLARVRVLARRNDPGGASRAVVDDLELDLRTRRVSRAGEVVDLSTREYALLAYLMQHAGQVLTRVQILAAVWDVDFDPQSNVVDVYVRYLRRKIDPPDAPSIIESVRGAGYRLLERRPPA
jgi:DNA-binding response OmpR family regulator